MDAKEEPKTQWKIFVGGLNLKTTGVSFRKYFSEFGEVVDSVVMVDPHTKKSRGFGFLEFASRAQVDACQAARPHIVDGKVVETKRAMPRHKVKTNEAVGESVKKIFVGGLRDLEEKDLGKYFTRFGIITRVDVLIDQGTGKSRGFGFVEFDDYDAVDKIVLQDEHNVKGIRIEVKKAVEKKKMDRMNRAVSRAGYGDQGNGFGGNYGGQGGYGGVQGSYGDRNGYSSGFGGGGYNGPCDYAQGGFGGGYGGGYVQQGFGARGNGGGYSAAYDYAQCSFGAGGNGGGFTNRCVRRYGVGYEGEAWRPFMRKGLQMQGSRVVSPKVKVEEAVQVKRGIRDGNSLLVPGGEYREGVMAGKRDFKGEYYEDSCVSKKIKMEARFKQEVPNVKGDRNLNGENVKDWIPFPKTEIKFEFLELGAIKEEPKTEYKVVEMMQMSPKQEIVSIKKEHSPERG